MVVCVFGEEVNGVLFSTGRQCDISLLRFQYCFFLGDSVNASVGEYVFLCWSFFVVDLVELLGGAFPLPLSPPLPSLASVRQSILVKLEDVN